MIGFTDSDGTPLRRHKLQNQSAAEYSRCEFLVADTASFYEKC